MSSKAEYLKRYASKDGTENSKPFKKRRKKSSDAVVANKSAITVVDEDLSWQSWAPSSERVDEAWELAGASEDAPVVVGMSDFQSNEKALHDSNQGRWEEVILPARGPQTNTSTVDSGRNGPPSPSASPPRRPRQSSPSPSPPRRRKQSSPSASPPRRPRQSSPSPSPPRRRKQSSPSASPPRRPRQSSPSPSPPRRRKQSSPSASPPRRPRQSSPSPSPPRRRKQSSRSASPPRRPRQSSPSSCGNCEAIHYNKRNRIETTSTGHRAGLQTKKDLQERERDLQRQREVERDEANKQKDSSSSTIYRDKHGKKLDMLNEFMRSSAATEGMEKKMKEAQFEWGRGTVQKLQTQQALEHIQSMAAEPFARGIDDASLEKEKKEMIRDGDPMAAYIASSRKKNEKMQNIGSHGELSLKKPKYEGPAAPPNRFQIQPGYRWDAIDRGNGFENKLLKRLSHRGSLKEDEYRWSAADM